MSSYQHVADNRHKHHFGGQTLTHSHEGGQLTHGYFGHKEDLPHEQPMEQRPEPCVWRDGPVVRQGQAGGYFVRSRTKPGVFYLVWGTECSCDNGQAHRDAGTLGNCWHLGAVVKFCQALNEKHKRPVGPPNVTALVD